MVTVNRKDDVFHNLSLYLQGNTREHHIHKASQNDRSRPVKSNKTTNRQGERVERHSQVGRRAGEDKRENEHSAKRSRTPRPVHPTVRKTAEGSGANTSKKIFAYSL